MRSTSSSRPFAVSACRAVLSDVALAKSEVLRTRHAGGPFRRFVALAVSLGILLTASRAEGKSLDRIGISVPDLDESFFTLLALSIQKDALEANPAVVVKNASCHYRASEQNDQIEQFIADKVNLIFFSPIDPKSLGPALKHAKDSGIILISLGAQLETGADGSVRFDDRQAGTEAGQYLADRLQGRGNVVLLNGPALNTFQDRVAAVLDVFKKYPEIKVVTQDQNSGATREGGTRVAAVLLPRFPQIDAVVAANDEVALGFMEGASQLQRTDFFIVGCGGSAEFARQMLQPGNAFAATPVQDPRDLAQQAFLLGIRLFGGESVETPNILLPVRLLTKDNLGDYQGW
ncbi:MAG: substrate-binding domain-containing protein [Verrucomicrobia bacterium]|nr:substrate-binding domain-containing protein [Verrucomicrobiota bacterium]